MGALSKQADRADYGGWLWSLARGADSRPQEDVNSCAAWMSDNSERARLALWSAPAPKPGTKAALKARDEAHERKSSIAQGILHLACGHASEKLARAAVDLGARGSLHGAAEAFEHGAPALAQRCLEQWLESPRGERQALDEAFSNNDAADRSAHASSSDELAPDTPLCVLFSKLSTTMAALSRSLDKSDDKQAEQAARERLSGIAADLRAFLLLAASLPTSSPAEARGQARLAGFAIAASSDLPEPAAMVRALRGAHPLADPDELAALFRRGKNALFKTRVADAAKSLSAQDPASASAWRSRMSELALQSMRAVAKPNAISHGPSAADIESLFIANAWPSKMAVELSCSSLGWTDDSPVQYCSKNVSPRVAAALSKAFAERESQLMAKASSKAGTPNKDAPRL
jgi:hypothetical protein